MVTGIAAGRRVTGFSLGTMNSGRVGKTATIEVMQSGGRTKRVKVSSPRKASSGQLIRENRRSQVAFGRKKAQSRSCPVCQRSFPWASVVWGAHWAPFGPEDAH
jgi:hypothetical protein